MVKITVKCNLCEGDFEKSPDSVVLCRHKGGVVHLGCCINKCSWDNKPCENAIAIYEKLE